MIGIIIITVIALVLAIILVTIDSNLNNNISEDYLNHLPGYNCGACGFAGCKGMSEAMLEDINNYKKCRPLRGEKLKDMENFLKSIDKI